MEKFYKFIQFLLVVAVIIPILLVVIVEGPPDTLNDIIEIFSSVISLVFAPLIVILINTKDYLRSKNNQEKVFPFVRSYVIGFFIFLAIFLGGVGLSLINFFGGEIHFRGGEASFAALIVTYLSLPISLVFSLIVSTIFHLIYNKNKSYNIDSN